MRFTQGYVDALNHVDVVGRDAMLVLGDLGGGVRRVPALKIAKWNVHRRQRDVARAETPPGRPMILFTLDEAEALLPQLREELLAMQALQARDRRAARTTWRTSSERSPATATSRTKDALAEKRRRAEALVEELNERLARINGWGVELKGIDEGLLDFPSEREGRVVYLCWRLGEERIGWWHEIGRGVRGPAAAVRYQRSDRAINWHCRRAVATYLRVSYDADSNRTHAIRLMRRRIALRSMRPGEWCADSDELRSLEGGGMERTMRPGAARDCRARGRARGARPLRGARVRDDALRRSSSTSRMTSAASSRRRACSSAR